LKTTKKIYVNGVTLAEAAGVKPAFVTQCKAHGYFQGAIRKKRDSYLAEYHREKCLAILADLDPAKQRKGGEGNGLYVEERGKLIRAQRRRLEFDEKVKKGLYISAEAAKAESVTAGRVLRDCLLNLPGKLSAVVAAKSKKAEKQIFQILRTEINKGLNEAIESLKKIGGDDESADI
jgi:phage terminase Nu1 subunit (DNA packaging protein)